MAVDDLCLSLHHTMQLIFISYKICPMFMGRLNPLDHIRILTANQLVLFNAHALKS